MSLRRLFAFVEVKTRNGDNFNNYKSSNEIALTQCVGLARCLAWISTRLR